MNDNQNNIKRASIYTLGCRLNQSESMLLSEKLEAAGYTLVPFGQEADLGIIHTCTVTHEADTKSRKMIRQFVRKNPQGYTAVIGCYAQVGSKVLSELEGVDLIVGNEEKLNLLDYVAEGKNTQPRVVRDKMNRDDFEVAFCAEGPPIERRMNLKIQDGCDFMCSFCIIPQARGRVRSRVMDDLLAEATSLVRRGAKELVLTGINNGTYQYQDQTILQIVENLNEIPGLARIRIGSIEMTTIPEELFALMRDPQHALTPYLHIPLQSGSNRVLEAMRRNYTREEYRDFLALARAEVPDIGLGADIMVGFPGETEEDFENTLDLVANSPLCYGHVFKYSGRRGTASERLPAKIDPQVANARSERLRQLCDAKTRTFGEQFLGQTVAVLFEDEQDGVWEGYTGNYLRVGVCSSSRLKNTLGLVTMNRYDNDRLTGTLLKNSSRNEE